MKSATLKTLLADGCAGLSLPQYGNRINTQYNIIIQELQSARILGAPGLHMDHFSAQTARAGTDFGQSVGNHQREGQRFLDPEVPQGGKEPLRNWKSTSPSGKQSHNYGKSPFFIFHG